MLKPYIIVAVSSTSRFVTCFQLSFLKDHLEKKFFSDEIQETRKNNLVIKGVTDEEREREDGTI